MVRLEERELPEPGDGIVEQRVEATSVGLPDVLMVRGNYPVMRQPPVAPGDRAVGIVFARGTP